MSRKWRTRDEQTREVCLSASQRLPRAESLGKLTQFGENQVCQYMPGVVQRCKQNCVNLAGG